MRWRLALGLTVGGVLLGGGLWAAFQVGLLPGPLPEPVSQPNLLLVTLDTTRADHLSTYGYFRKTTPHLDALARRSWVFDAAWAPMATTLPSHTSLMTGAWPLEHGVLGNVEHGGRTALPSDQLLPVAELFRGAGYRTAAFVSANPLRKGTGIERGFEVFNDPEKAVRHARATTNEALAWLRKNGKHPFFLWVHYFDAHGPFEPPKDAPQRFQADAALKAWMAERAIPEVAFRTGGAVLEAPSAHDGYDAEIRYVDEHMQRLLDLLEKRGWSDETVVVVVGDHGEGLGQHDVGGHGQVWREQVQVPLVVHIPWQGRHRRIDTPISMVDVMPTVLSAFPELDVKGWRALASGRDVLTQGPAPSLALSSLRQDAMGADRQTAITVGRWRLITVGEQQHLFDLATDPHELRDLSALLPVHRALLSRWARQLEVAQRERGRQLGTGGTVELSEEDLEILRALGYLE